MASKEELWLQLQERRCMLEVMAGLELTAVLLHDRILPHSVLTAVANLL